MLMQFVSKVHTKKPFTNCSVHYVRWQCIHRRRGWLPRPPAGTEHHSHLRYDCFIHDFCGQVTQAQVPKS